MAALKIKYKNPHQLKPRARNPRTHTAKQIKQIAVSIKEFGFISPVLIDGADGISAGHGRVEAAKLVGMSDVPTVRVDHLTPAQIRAYGDLEQYPLSAISALAERAVQRSCQGEPPIGTVLTLGRRRAVLCTTPHGLHP